MNQLYHDIRALQLEVRALKARNMQPVIRTVPSHTHTGTAVSGLRFYVPFGSEAIEGQVHSP